jgi:hypothetical protein
VRHGCCTSLLAPTDGPLAETGCSAGAGTSYGTWCRGQRASEIRRPILPEFAAEGWCYEHLPSALIPNPVRRVETQ